MTNEAVFEKDIPNKQMTVTRSFNGTLPLLWKAWTTAEILDQWWAPKPFRNETKSMDFREDGAWLYSMVSPQNERHYCRADYKTIFPEQSFSYVDSFTDENGTPTGFPGMNWLNVFSEDNGTTTVKVNITFKDEEAMDKIIEMGFKEGFTMGMNNLDEYLAKHR